MVSLHGLAVKHYCIVREREKQRGREGERYYCTHQRKAHALGALLHIKTEREKEGERERERERERELKYQCISCERHTHSA